MTLQNQYGITYNLKRIRRIMKKFKMICPIRKANPARRMAKATKEHRTCEDKLNRHFKQGVAGKVLLTDITYLTYKGGKRAYLSTIKDAETNEILAYEVSSSLSMKIALNTLYKLKKHHHLTEDTFIHSDLNECETLEEVKREIKSYMTYYNHYRGQWNLKKLPPVKYRQQLQQVA